MLLFFSISTQSPLHVSHQACQSIPLARKLMLKFAMMAEGEILLTAHAILA
jgi:hypothetical protein